MDEIRPSTEPPKAQGPRRFFESATLKVAAIFVSGVIINQLSDTFELPSEMLFIVAFVVLIAMIALESGGHWTSINRATVLREMRGAIAFFLLGVMVTGGWFLPIFRSLQLRIPGVGEFLGAELGAIICISLVGAVASWRGQTVVRLAIFVASAVTGLSFVAQVRTPDLVPADYNFSLAGTFTGWFAVGAAVALIARLGRLSLSNGRPRRAGRSIARFAKGAVGIYSDFLQVRVERSADPSERVKSVGADGYPLESSTSDVLEPKSVDPDVSGDGSKPDVVRIDQSR